MGGAAAVRGHRRCVMRGLGWSSGSAGRSLAGCVARFLRRLGFERSRLSAATSCRRGPTGSVRRLGRLSCRASAGKAPTPSYGLRGGDGGRARAGVSETRQGQWDLLSKTLAANREGSGVISRGMLRLFDEVMHRVLRVEQGNRGLPPRLRSFGGLARRMVCCLRRLVCVGRVRFDVREYGSATAQSTGIIRGTASSVRSRKAMLEERASVPRHVVLHRGSARMMLLHRPGRSAAARQASGWMGRVLYCALKEWADER